MTEKNEIKIANFVIYQGKIDGKEIALLQSGIGKGQQSLELQHFYR